MSNTKSKITIGYNYVQKRWPSWYDWNKYEVFDPLVNYLGLKQISKPKHTRLKFGLEKPKDPNVLETFQAMIGRKFAPLTIMNNGDADMDSMIITFNTAVTETASEVLGKHCQKKKTLGHCRNSWSVQQKDRGLELRRK